MINNKYIYSKFNIMETKKYLKIDEILQTKRITLPDLSAKTGIKTENLHTILKKNTTINTLKRIAKALEYRIEDLVKQRISAHGYISYSINGTKHKDEVFDEIERIQKRLKSVIKKIRTLEIKNKETTLYDRFNYILESQEYNINDVVDAINIKNNSRTTKQNIITSLQKNPNLKIIVDICDVLDIELSELLSSNTNYKIQGVVVINGDVITLNALSDLERAVGVIGELINNKITVAEIENIISEILSVENHESETQESYEISDLNYSEDNLRMDKPSRIDSTKELCYSFRKKGDLRGKKLLNFSNMLKGYPFEFLGHQFKDSECAYIAGCYTSNNDHCKRIQKELSDYDKGGYNAKAEYRKADVEKSMNTPHIRPDWNSFNFQWMLLVLFFKTKNNLEFRNMLMDIPLNAHIIEDTSYHKGHTAGIWGCKNKDLTKLRIAKRSSLRTKLLEKGVFKLKTLSYAEQIIDNRINNIGTWVGQNATGKALKLCQIAIEKEELPPINFELLNNSNIFWFGERIRIFATADGRDITYEVIRQ